MNKITFDTIHLESTDIEMVEDLEQFEKSNHLISIKDRIEYNKDKDAFYYTYLSTHKLYDETCREAIEITIVSIFKPHVIPPNLIDCQEMAKCHFFHTEAILSEKSKNQRIKCFKDIFLFPEDAKLGLRGSSVFNASENYLQQFK